MIAGTERHPASDAEIEMTVCASRIASVPAGMESDQIHLLLHSAGMNLSYFYFRWSGTRIVRAALGADVVEGVGVHVRVAATHFSCAPIYEVYLAAFGSVVQLRETLFVQMSFEGPFV